MNSRFLTIIVLVSLLYLPSVHAAAPQHNPDKMFRTINTDSYEVGARKNGETDVTLTSRDPVFISARPLVWFDGEPEPKPLNVTGSMSQRDSVNNRLGEGHGLVFEAPNSDWTIQAYPTKPYLTAQVSYVNTGKKSVKIKMLIPWAAILTLGPSTDQSVILENGRTALTTGDLPAKVTGTSLSLWNAAVYNAFSKRNLIAGFISADRALTQIRIERDPKNDVTLFDAFRAECVYDPPLEIKPGERLDSEVLYLAVAEPNPLDGLERYGASYATFNNLKHKTAFLPHGWDSWNTRYKTDINEERIMAALDFMDKNLKRYGWKHFAIDAGWELGKGNWEPDPAKFPHGMKWMADQIHARGMTAGLWLDPFTVDANSPLAKEHPDWLKMPTPETRSELEEGDRILDITISDARDYVRDLCSKISTEWGYDAIQECDFAYHLMYADTYTESGVTRIDVFNKGMQAVRESFGPGKFITAFTPLPASGLYANAMRIGDDCAPIWKKAPDKCPWGCVDAMTNAARRYYFAPNAWATDPDCAYFAHPETATRWEVSAKPALTWDQSLTWLTAAALTGGVVKIGDWLPDLSPKEVAVLQRLLPTLSRPARPVDLFERDVPNIWSLPIRTEIGQWTIVGIFNWDETASRKIPVAFEDLGLDPNIYYTVYDFWSETYHGLAQGRLNVDTAPGACHLLGLRRYEDHPMFLATDRHFSQGATDFKALSWSAPTRTLTGTFDAVADTDYNLRILVPESYALKSANVSGATPTTQQEGKVLKLSFRSTAETPLTWTLQF